MSSSTNAATATAVPAIHPPRRRRWIVVAIAALVTAAAIAWIVVRRRERAAAAPAFVYETATVDRGPIQARVTATGTVNPTVTVQVGSQVSGTIQALGADFNSVVDAGRMIAQIDPRPFRAAVAQATANVHAARANVVKARAAAEDARRIADRDHALYAQQLIAAQEADTAEANARVAEAQIDAARAAAEQAQAALARAQLDLEYTTIRAPIHGTVITRNVDVGQTVAASFAAPTLFLIGGDLTQMEVDTNIAEAEVGRLAPGMIATFTVDAFPSRIFRGTIRQVRASPQIIQNVVTYNAVVDVANPDLALKPGMTANLDVVYADRASVVRVPNAALRFHAPAPLASSAPASPPPGARVVWIAGPAGAAPRAVTIEIGVSDGTYTELRGGAIAPGDALVVEANPTGASSRVRSIL